MTSGKVMISLSIWPRAAAGENKRSRATRQLGSRESQEDCAEFEESTRALLASSRLGRQFPLQGKGEQGESKGSRQCRAWKLKLAATTLQ